MNSNMVKPKKFDHLHVVCYFTVPLSHLAAREATRIYQFINNNKASFHLWLEGNLVKHQKLSKYYDHGCLQNFCKTFMSLLTVPTVKNSHILAGIYLIFKK